MLENLHLLKLF